MNPIHQVGFLTLMAVLGFLSSLLLADTIGWLARERTFPALAAVVGCVVMTLGCVVLFAVGVGGLCPEAFFALIRLK